jgi:hypothetical protein
MLQSELVQCLSEIGNLWPNADLTDGELALLRDRLSGHDRGDVIGEIREHRLESETRPKFGRLLDRIAKRKTANEKFTAAQKIDHVSFAAVIRGQWREAGQSANFDDLETYLRYFAGIWNTNNCRRDDATRNSLASQLGNCLRDLGIPDPTAAENYFVSGQKISREFFTAYLDELRGLAAPVAAGANGDMPW